MICVGGNKGMGWLKLDSWVVSEKKKIDTLGILNSHGFECLVNSNLDGTISGLSQYCWGNSDQMRNYYHDNAISKYKC